MPRGLSHSNGEEKALEDAANLHGVEDRTLLGKSMQLSQLTETPEPHSSASRRPGLFARLPLGQKIVAICVATCVTVLVCASAASTALEAREIRLSMVESVHALASVIGFNIRAALDFQDAGTAERILSSLEELDDVISAAVYDREGGLVAEYCRDDRGHGTECSRPSSLASETSPIQERFHHFGDDYLEVDHDIRLEGQRIGAIKVRVDLSRLDRYLASNMRRTAVVLLVAVVAAIGLAMQLQRVISKPVAELANTIQAVATSDDYSIRVTPTLRRRTRCAHGRSQHHARTNRPTRPAFGRIGFGAANRA